jgi:hypothetical protein
VDYAHHPVTAKGYVDRVQLCRGGKVIAEHLRCWDREQQVFDPKHYLRLIQHKPGSLDHARPLADWDLPECFAALRRRLEADLEDGTREYIRVLRLLERHCVKEVATAVERGLGMRAHTRDAIAQFLLPAEPWEATTFRLDGLEHLRCVKVACCDVSAYRGLLGAGLSRASLSGGVA